MHRIQTKNNKHRCAAILLMAAVLFCALRPAGVLAENTAVRPDILSMPETNILLADADDPEGCIDNLSKNADEKAYPASIVKLLTALVALEHNSLTDTVTVTEHAVDLSGANTKVGLRVGEKYSLEDLLYASLLPSACDAARAVADLVSGGEEAFAALMNEKAQSLGMTDSHFTNASGLHDEMQYTTCRDLVRLGKACSENEVLCSILTTKDYTLKEKTTGRKISVRNINRLIRDPNPADYEKIQCIYPYCIGGKTGSTNAAGLTFMAIAQREGKTLVCVLLGNHESTQGLKGTPYDRVIAARFQEACDLFTYGYSLLFPSVTAQALMEKGLKSRFSVPVDGTDGKAVPASASYEGTAAVSVAKEVADDPSRVTVSFTGTADANTKQGDTVGEAVYSYAGSVLFRLPLVAEADAVPPTPSPVPTALPVAVETAPAPTPVPSAGPGKANPLLLLQTFLLILIALLLAGTITVLVLLRKKARRTKRRSRK